MVDPAQSQETRRRTLVRMGTFAGLGSVAGLGFEPGRIWAETRLKPRAKSVVILFAGGGPSQLETWDMRPDAPSVVRGAFKPINTDVPGISICEHLPKLAQMAKHYSIYKTLSHEDIEHGSACYLALTGHYHSRKTSNPDPRSDDRPAVSCLARKLKPEKVGPFGAFHLNGPLLTPITPGPGQYPGVLGPAYGAIGLGDPRLDPATLLGLKHRIELPKLRIDGRRILQNQLENMAHATEAALDQAESHAMRDIVLDQGYRLLEQPNLRIAFDLTRENKKVHDRYGRHRMGQACLLAKRLVEANTPWVTVFLNQSIRGQDLDPTDGDACGWDTHNDLFEAMETMLLPRLDQAMSALLTDLSESGRLQDTLVICMGEFGRSPLVAYEKRFVGNTPGRKHWAATYPMVVAGAGTQPGRIIGATDRHAAYPMTEPAGPWDVAVTCLEALGIPANGSVIDREGRLLTLPDGRLIEKLWTGT